jgi:hypothetical protein
MENFPYVETGTYLFRFMDHRSTHFWSALTQILSEQKLFLNSRRNYNDPFDSQPIIESDLSNSSIRDYLQSALADPFNPKRSPQATARILELRASGATSLKKKRLESIKGSLRENAQKILDNAGLLSFSLTAENPLLWGHYAASFKGVCAVFRRGISLKSGLALCARVAYVDERPRLRLSLIHEMTRRRMADENYDELAKQIFFLSFLHKSRHWAYEQEARVFCPFHAFKKLPFDPQEFVGLILGPNSSDELQTRIKDEVGKRRPSISLDKASLSPTEFRIIIPHKFIRHHADAA